MKIKGLLLAAIALISLSASAQDWSQDVYKYGEQYPGYVIMEDGTKVEGFIKYKNRSIMQREVVFFSEKGNNKTKTKYKSADLKEYKVADKLYHCINYSGGLNKKAIRGNLVISEGCIMEYRWYGNIELSEGRKVNRGPGESYDAFLDRKYPPETVYYKEGDERPVTTDYFALKFAKKMSEYIADNAELSAKVASKEKGYRMLAILTIIEEYNENCEE
jgi:hypothetical protein